MGVFSATRSTLRIGPLALFSRWAVLRSTKIIVFVSTYAAELVLAGVIAATTTSRGDDCANLDLNVLDRLNSVDIAGA